MGFIDDHRDAHGVEPICEVLPIAPSTYHAHEAQQADPSKRSSRALRDAALCVEIERVWKQNRSVYGPRKVCRQLKWERFEVARCTVERPFDEFDECRAGLARIEEAIEATVGPLARARSGR